MGHLLKMKIARSSVLAWIATIKSCKCEVRTSIMNFYKMYMLVIESYRLVTAKNVLACFSCNISSNYLYYLDGSSLLHKSKCLLFHNTVEDDSAVDFYTR